SVLEYALKREGFLRTGHRNAAEPDWDSFGRQVESSVDRDPAHPFSRGLEQLRALRPKRQVVHGHELAWERLEQQSQDSDAVYGLRLLKTVRNNLFHGGKYPDGSVAEVARD